jgi:hypothetical protein
LAGLSDAARRHPVLPAVHGPSFPAAAFCRCDRAIPIRANRVRRHAQSHAICTRNRHVKRKRNSRADFLRAHAAVRCTTRDDAADASHAKPAGDSGTAAMLRGTDGNGRRIAPAAAASPLPSRRGATAVSTKP